MKERRKESRPSLDRLRQLNGFASLSDARLESLRERLTLRSAPANKVLVSLGATDDSVLYLLYGEIELRAHDGAVKRIHHTAPAARAPISRLRPSRFEVRANSRVEFLLIDNAMLEHLNDVEEAPSEDTYEVQEHLALPSESLESQLLIHVYEDLSSKQLQMPCIPDVSVQVGTAAVREGQSVSAIADWLLFDPVLALKVMKFGNSYVANSAMPRSLPDTVARIGIEGTQKLIVRSVMLESCQDMPLELQGIYRNWWRRSVQLSALTREMAHACGRFDPDFAALAGLLQGLGEGVAICYASRIGDSLVDAAALERSVARSGREIGQAVLTMWGMPRDIVTCAMESANWGRLASRADYVDLVLLAQLQVAHDDDEDTRELPELTRIPAFRRLGLGGNALDPLITETARLAVSEAEALIDLG